jgi:hypothetical protein
MTIKLTSYVVAGVAALSTMITPDAAANDRDLKATHIPAAACDANNSYNVDLRQGIHVPGDQPGALNQDHVWRCALPLNNVDLGGTTNDNDMSSFTVFYMDSDGAGTRVNLKVDLWENTVGANGLVSTLRCPWNSNQEGSGSTAYTSKNKPCAVDLGATSFYFFTVTMRVTAGSGNPIDAALIGTRFP